MKIVPLILVLVFGCINTDKKENQDTQKQKSDTTYNYPTVSYLDLKLENGQLPSNPYIVEFTNGKKKIVFCGTMHLSKADLNNPLYKKIEAAFFAFRPDVCVNEGGDISQKIYTSKKEAILSDGEIGLTKILADSLKLSCVNGDMNEAYEFKNLLQRYSTEEFIAYVVNERLMWELKGRKIFNQQDVEKEFNKFIQGYIMTLGKVNLTETEQSFDFFKASFEKTVGRPFDINRPEPSNPFDPKGKFQEIGRVSKQIRDQNLIGTIDQLLDAYDKIFIVFGGWHLFTCKPGIEEIINRKRK
ncbi:hypothetical protein [Sediminibacterium sp.]|uniref:hypothetical protein n=1 Tax=Sediminibacterium sp. TaxID=1917865 RepID=UPI003F6E5C8C